MRYRLSAGCKGLQILHNFWTVLIKKSLLFQTKQTAICYVYKWLRKFYLKVKRENVKNSINNTFYFFILFLSSTKILKRRIYVGFCTSILLMLYSFFDFLFCKFCSEISGNLMGFGGLEKFIFLGDCGIEKATHSNKTA